MRAEINAGNRAATKLTALIDKRTVARYGAMAHYTHVDCSSNPTGTVEVCKGSGGGFPPVTLRAALRSSHG